MADDRYWVGGISGDVDVDGNWKQSDLVSASAKPVDGDSVYCVTGSRDMDTNLAMDDIALVNFRTTPGYSGQFGAEGTPLQIDATNFTFDSRGAKNYIQFKSDADATDTVVLVLGTSTNADALHLSTSTNGTISSGVYLGGNVTIDDSAAHKASTNVLIGSSNAASSVSVTIGASVTNLATLTHVSGNAIIGSAFAELVQVGGTAQHTAGALTAAIVYSGTFRPESSDTVGSITALNGAFVDGSRSTNARTWTAVEIFQGSRISIANTRGNITLTNGIKTQIVGALPITVDQGRTVSIS